MLNYKKIILLGMFSWFYVAGSQPLFPDMKGVPTTFSDATEIAVLFSASWMINVFIKTIFQPTTQMNNTMCEKISYGFKKIGYGIQAVGYSDGFSMIAKSILTTCALWQLKNYYYQK